MFLSTGMFLFAEGFLSAEVSLSIEALLVTCASLSMEALRPVEDSAFCVFTMSPSASRCHFRSNRSSYGSDINLTGQTLGRICMMDLIVCIFPAFPDPHSCRHLAPNSSDTGVKRVKASTILTPTSSFHTGDTLIPAISNFTTFTNRVQSTAPVESAQALL